MQVVSIDDFNALANTVAKLQAELNELKGRPLLLDEVLVDQAAAMLRVSTSTIRRLIKAGELPYRREGTTIRIPVTALKSRKALPQ